MDVVGSADAVEPQLQFQPSLPCCLPQLLMTAAWWTGPSRFLPRTNRGLMPWLVAAATVTTSSGASAVVSATAASVLMSSVVALTVSPIPLVGASVRPVTPFASGNSSAWADTNISTVVVPGNIVQASEFSTLLPDAQVAVYNNLAEPLDDIFSNSYAPSSLDVRSLQARAADAERVRTAQAEIVEAKRKEMEVLQDCLKAASVAADSFSKKASVAAMQRLQEDQRIAALPALAKKAREMAAEERRKRLEAEERVVAARNERVRVEQERIERLDQLRKAITKQRVINRVRAAEDARITSAAIEAARQARAEVASRHLSMEKLEAAAVSGDEHMKAAKVLASQAIVNATETLTGRVSGSAAKSVQAQFALADAKRTVDELREKAATSAAAAQEAQRLAFEDRSRADAARLGKVALEDFAVQQREAYQSTEAAVPTSRQNVTAAAGRLIAATAEKNKAVSDAFKRESEAVRALKLTADKAGQVSGLTSYAQDLAGTAPAAFIDGLSRGFMETS
eukprot:TRINITY_DN24086_c0_g2_i1.p1 TRINITY_DN24086_c0_g2~~TRINITY_DN24086_c0_g2_i1.p1  ORF type:complete len:511 (+),score=97.03 TRINITY_DN24086_c0_g2_i1:140-1672(+)